MDKVIDIEERIPTLRERRRRRTNKKFFLLLFIFLFTILGLLYFQSPYSHVDKITVHGASLNDEHTYIKKSGLAQGDSLWGFSSSAIEKELKKANEVKNVTVKRKLLNDVEISVEEWDKIAYVETDGKYEFLLSNGTVFSSPQEGQVLDAPILNNFDDKKVLTRLTKELSSVPSEVYHLISQITYDPSETDEYSLQVFMNDGYEVRAIIPSFAEKMAYYPSIIAQIPSGQKGVIDLEVGSFYRSYQDVYGPIVHEEVDADEQEKPE